MHTIEVDTRRFPVDFIAIDGVRIEAGQTLTVEVEALTFGSPDFGVLPEVLVRLHAEGYRVAEVPFQFASRATWRAERPAEAAGRRVIVGRHGHSRRSGQAG